MELELATAEDIIAELQKRPNEKWIHFHQRENGLWEIFGASETNIDETAIMLSGYVTKMLQYQRDKKQK